VGDTMGFSTEFSSRALEHVEMVTVAE